MEDVTPAFPDCCGGDDAANSDAPHECGFVNENCPAECSTDHAAPPSPDRYADPEWACPETGDRYRYCHECGWEPDDWRQGSTYIGGRWYCDPFEHGFDSCESCEEWGYGEDFRWHEDREATYCESCYPSGDYNDEDNDDYGSVERLYCGTCGEHNDHYVPATESYVCRCQLPGEAVAA